jgi:periplasmic divalent cation tolerance protein
MANSMEAIVVFITAGSAEEAERIASALLEARQVACVNTVGGVDSRFWWEGRLDRAAEVLLIAKTCRELWPNVLETVRQHHSYEVFEAIALPILESNPDYLNWIMQSTVPSAGAPS